MLSTMEIVLWLFLLAIALAGFYLIGRLSASVKMAPPTKRRAAFKVRYGLNVRQPISEFEEKILDGMSRERNEVWVAAFCSESEVLKVTANVGSRYKSRASDNVSNWPKETHRVGASQIRQYHSHPPGLGCSSFSQMDRETYRRLKPFLEQHGLQFHAYLVYRELRGYRIRSFGGERDPR
jgi:hypothetical protein